jgi:hypothetical protein
MRRFSILFGIMLAALIAAGTAQASSTFSGLPAATQPLGTVPDYVPMDQGTGCPNGSPCATVQSPSLRFGQPVQQVCSSIATPFPYQQCIDTSVTPRALRVFLGSTWVTIATLDSADGLWVPYPIQTTCSSITQPQPYEQCIDTSLSPPVLKVYLGIAWAPVGAMDSVNGIWTPPIGGGNPTTLVAAGTTNLCSVPQSALTISGSTAITSFGSCTAGIIKVLTFSGTPTVDYNSANLILPAQENYAASVNDVMWVQSLGGSSWQAVAIQPSNGLSPVQGAIYGGGPATIAMQPTTDLSTVPNANVIISGSAITTALGNVPAGYEKWLTFSGNGGTLVNNAVSLILPGGANIATSAGDTAVVLSLGAGDWRLVAYEPALDSRPTSPWNWQFPTSTTFTAALVNNGQVISSKSATGALTITLPAVTAIPVGWNLGFAVEAGDAITLALNGGNPGTLSFSNGTTGSTFTTTTGYQIDEVQFDGTTFRLSQNPAAADLLTGSVIQVQTEAALAAMSTAAYPAVYRTGYYKNADSPMLAYYAGASPCSLNAGAGDGGSQIPSSNGECWLARFPAGAADIREWGAVGSGSTATGIAGAASTSMTLSTALDFSNNNPISIFGSGAAFVLNQPTGVTVMTDGVSGATKWCAVVLVIDAASGWGNQSAEACNGSDGSSVLYGPDGTHAYAGEIVAWSAPTGTSPTAYAIYFGPQGNETCFTTTIQTSWEAFGPGPGPGNTTSKVPWCPAWLPLTPPGLGNSQADLQGNTISAGAATTGLTLGTPTISAVASTYPSASGSGFTNIVLHENGPAINAALADMMPIQGPMGTFPTTQPLAMSETNGQPFGGCGRLCFTVQGWGSGFTTTNGIVESAGATSFDQKINDMTIDGSEVSSGWCLYLSEAPHFDIERVNLPTCYDEWEISGGSANGTADTVDGTLNGKNGGAPSEARGDYGVQIISTDNLNTGVQRLNRVLVPKMFQGVGSDIDGHVPTLYLDNWSFGVGPSETKIDNIIGASGVPTFVAFSNTGWNGCWGTSVYGCIDDNDGISVSIYNGYVQDYDNGGTASDNTILVGSAAKTYTMTGGQAFGGGNTIVDANGTNVILSGVWLHGASGASTVAAKCESGAGLVVSGGSDLTATSSGTTVAYGALFNSGCNGGNTGVNSISGNWIGTTIDALDNTGVAGAVRIGWLPPGSTTTASANSAGGTFTAAAFCGGWGASLSYIQRSGPSTAFTDTSPTATLCANALPANQTTFTVRIKNTSGHQETIDPGTNFTFSGDAIVSSNIVIPNGDTADCYGYAVSSGPTGTAYCTLLK